MSEIYFKNPRVEFGPDFFRFWKVLDEKETNGSGLTQEEFVGKNSEISSAEISLYNNNSVFKITLKDGRTIRVNMEKGNCESSDYEKTIHFCRFQFYKS